MVQNRYHVFKAIEPHDSLWDNVIYFCSGRPENDVHPRTGGKLIYSTYLQNVAEEIMEDYLNRIGTNSGLDLEFKEIEKRHRELIIEFEPLFGKITIDGLNLENAHNFENGEREEFRKEFQVARDHAFKKRKFCNSAAGLGIKGEF